MTSFMLSDRIEKFILDLLDKESSNELLFKRKDVADLLECAPSQVTYVVNTRFSSNSRYVVESRRGNGGYIKISLRQPAGKKNQKGSPSASGTQSKKETQVDTNDLNTIESDLDGYLKMLRNYDLISDREYKLLSTMTDTTMIFCPENYRKEAAKTIIHHLNFCLKGD